MPHIFEINKQNFHTYSQQLQKIENLSFASPWNINAFKTELNNKISHTWALKKDNILFGYICFWMFANEVQILNIAISPEYRMQEYGLYLLKRLIEKSRSKDVKHIWLEVRPSNLPARKLYQKTGFIETHRRPKYYPDTKESAIIMVLNI